MKVFLLSFDKRIYYDNNSLKIRNRSLQGRKRDAEIGARNFDQKIAGYCNDSTAKIHYFTDDFQ